MDVQEIGPAGPFPTSVHRSPEIGNSITSGTRDVFPETHYPFDVGEWISSGSFAANINIPVATGHI